MGVLVLGYGRPREVPCPIAGCGRRWPVWSRNERGERVGYAAELRRHVRERHGNRLAQSSEVIR